MVRPDRVPVPVGVARVVEGLELGVSAHLIPRPVADSARRMAPRRRRLRATVGRV